LEEAAGWGAAEDRVWMAWVCGFAVVVEDGCVNGGFVVLSVFLILVYGGDRGELCAVFVD
jgi:hypothetical protein